MRHTKGKAEGVTPSAALPFVNIRTDGKPKLRHANEISFILSLLKLSGVREFRAEHIYDVGYSKEIPTSKNGKVYDIGYKSRDGEIFLIEVMRLTYGGKK